MAVQSLTRLQLSMLLVLAIDGGWMHYADVGVALRPRATVPELHRLNETCAALVRRGLAREHPIHLRSYQATGEGVRWLMERAHVWAGKLV